MYALTCILTRMHVQDVLHSLNVEDGYDILTDRWAGVQSLKNKWGTMWGCKTLDYMKRQ